jgi:sugar lactone lactonase YvrE
MSRTRTSLTFVAGLASALLSGHAQQFAISTFAGGSLGTTGLAAIRVAIGYPQGVAVDATGNLYFVSSNSVFKVDADGVLKRIAGNLHPGYAGDGGPGVESQLSITPGLNRLGSASLAIDDSGNVYISDYFNERIRKVSIDGSITTLAQIAARGLAIDSGRNLYFINNCSVRKLSPSGSITTVAGDGYCPDDDEGVMGTSAALINPSTVAVDAAGNLFVAELNRVRKIDMSGTITTVAGDGTLGDSGDGGPATRAQLSATSITLDSAGNLYIVGNHRVRKVSPAGIISTVAGNGIFGFSGDGGSAIDAQLYGPSGAAVGANGDLYIADMANRRIRKVSTDGILTTVAGGGDNGDGGPASKAVFDFFPWGGGMGADGKGNLYIADSADVRIRKVSGDGTISTVAGTGAIGFSGDGGPATKALLSYPSSVAIDSSENLYIADTNNLRVRKVSPAGLIATMAGNGKQAPDGDGIPAAGAGLRGVQAVALDTAGNVYVADGCHGRVQQVSPDGTISTVVARETAGSSQGVARASAQIGCAWGLAVDNADTLYVGDVSSNVVWKVLRSGAVSVVAGNGIAGYSGDGGPATSAQLNAPAALAVDTSGNLYIADAFNNRIRMVSPQGIITTVGGTGVPGYSGDGGSATKAEFGLLSGLTIDATGNLYASDQYYNVIRVLRPVRSASAGQ